jgi:hypothetical protein
MSVHLSHRRAWEIAALLLLALLMTGVCFLVSAHVRAQVPGQIQGNVTAVDTGLPLADVTVQAYDTSGYPAGSPVNTGAGGDYTISALDAGSYRVSFSPTDGLHGGIYYLDRSDLANADQVVVQSGLPTTGIDQVVPLAGSKGSILGVATAADGGAPLGGVDVQAYRFDGTPVTPVSVTNSSGEYIIPELDAASYRIYFYPKDGLHIPIYYLDQKDLDSATQVVVNTGAQTTGIDQALPVGSSISGKITGAENGQPLQSCIVNLNLMLWDVHGWTAYPQPAVMTDASGNYKFEGLVAGPYKVEAAARDSLHYMSWWWNGKPTIDKADAVMVTEGQSVTDADISVPAGCNIHGTVTDTNGFPVPGVTCTAYIYDTVSKTYISAGSTVSSSDLGTMGQYGIGPLTSAGTYKVDFEPSDEGHVGIWFNDKETMAAADPFALTIGMAKLVNPVLPVGAVIAGKVMSNDPDHMPIENAWVYAYRKVGTSWNLEKKIQTKDNGGKTSGESYDDWGKYQLNPLRPGVYTVLVVPDRTFWHSQWWERKISVTTATQTDLGPGDLMTGTDFYLDWVARNPGPIPPGQVTPPEPPDPIYPLLQVPTSEAAWTMEAMGLTPADWSDLAPRLGGAGYGYTLLSTTFPGNCDLLNLSLLKRFDVVFVNCSGQFVDGYKQLELGADTPFAEYVKAGGRVYLADCAADAVRPDFGNGSSYPFTLYDPAQQALGPPESATQIVHASIVDAGMSAALGVTTKDITYERGGDVVVKSVDPAGTISMRGSVQTDHVGTVNNSTISVVEPFDAGKIYLQTFHLNHMDSASATKLLHYWFGLMPKPKLTTISPTSGSVGATVKLTGSYFGSVQGESVVWFGDVKVTKILSWTSTVIQVEVPSGAATGLVTVQTSSGASNGIKFTVNGASAGSTWYLAEGTSDYGFTTYVTMENPNSSAVTAQVTYMTPTGAVARPDVPLPGYSQTTINPANDLGAKDFSTKVICKEGKTIAVDRRMIWTGQGAPSQEGHASIGVTSPQKTWYFAEGSADWGFECWLLVQNPAGRAAKLTVTYMLEGGGTQVVAKSVGANSRMTWSMGADIGNKDASIKIASDQLVIAERSMYRNSRREGHNSIGTNAPSSNFYLAEGTTNYGFTTYVLVQNPNNLASDVQVTYMTGGGAVAQPAFSLPANSRKTVRVNDVAGMQNKDFSTRVTGSQQIIAERAMYWGAGSSLGEACHDSIGLAAPHTTFYLPDGATDYGHETFTCVQNPNPSAIQIELIYLPAGGTANEQPIIDTIPANSRRTYNMGDKIPSGKASILVNCTTANKKIMVERAMYWYHRGAGTDTIGGYSDNQ